jgi:tryptophan synthase alpha chain
MSRLAETFARLRGERRTGLVTFVTAGDPDAARSAAVLRALDRGGADVLEVGVPFSDPLADGPVIQRSSERALRAGGGLRATIELVRSVRRAVKAPIVIFTYANPLLRLGLEPFASKAAGAGADGVLVLDLPIEEAGELRAATDAAGLDLIFLLSPTSTDARIQAAADLGSGFLYGISRLGVTGVRDALPPSAADLGRRVRQITARPLALGFGISRPEHVEEVGQHADAAVVGSALVQFVAEAAGSADLELRVAAYVRWLSGRGMAAGWQEAGELGLTTGD